jgi:hypothetical protein
MDNAHVHAKMHARLHELSDKGCIIDTSLYNIGADVQLNNSRTDIAMTNTTTTLPSANVTEVGDDFYSAAYNLSQLKRLDSSDKDQTTNTNTTTPTKENQDLVQRMKSFPSTRRKSSPTVPPAA